MPMLARVAENLFWMGRYLERAENTARLCDVTRLQTSEHALQGDPWDTLLATLSATEAFEEFRESEPETSAEQFLVWSARSPVSIVTNVGNARGLATELREHISREVFAEVNQLFLTLRRAGGRGAVPPATQEVRRAVSAVYGLFENTVLQVEGAHWFRFGILLERADMTSRIVDAKYFISLPQVEDVGGALDRYQWRGVLRSASGLEAYRKTFRGSIRVARSSSGT